MWGVYYGRKIFSFGVCGLGWLTLRLNGILNSEDGFMTAKDRMIFSPSDDQKEYTR